MGVKQSGWGGKSLCSETVISSSILRSEGLFLVSLKARVRLDMSVMKIALEQRGSGLLLGPYCR